MAGEPPSLAVVTAIDPRDRESGERSAASVRQVADHHPGPFSRVVHLPPPDAGGAAEGAGWRNRGVAMAAEAGTEWVFHLEAGEVLAPDALVNAAPALAAYDALWGARGILDDPAEAVRVPKEAAAACHGLCDFLHAVLYRWFGRGHFVRTRIARMTPFDEAAGEAWYMDYMVRLWRRHRCIKTTHAHVAGTGEPAYPTDGEREFLHRHLDREPAFISFQHRGRPVELPYTGRNPVLERAQLGGRFFEQRELDYLAERVPRGGTVIEVGANTGNHTVFFALFLEARRIVVVEPHPLAVAALERTIETNRLETVDTSRLGLGVGARRGRFAIHLPPGKGTGSTRLVADEAGEIEVLPLDDLIDGPVDFLKIDVEHMEIEVLEGARGLVSRHRPLIFIEVMDPNIAAFRRLVEELGYGIEKVFPEIGYGNYFMSPL